MPENPSEKQTSDPELTTNHVKIVTEQLGIWHLRSSEHGFYDFGKHWRDLVSVVPWFYRMAVDVYHLSPFLFIAFVVSMIWSGLESAILTHLSSQLLKVIETGLKNKSHSREILSALTRRLAFVALAATVKWWSTSLNSVIKGRVTYHLEIILMQAKLQVDLVTHKGAINTMQTTAEDAWHAFRDISSFFTEFIAFASQLALIGHLSRSFGGPIFVVFCIAKPLITTFCQRSIWSKVCIGYVSDPNFNRMKAMHNLATDDSYKQDVHTGNLANYILNEYKKAYKKIDVSSTDHPYYAYERFSSPWFDIIKQLSGDLPTVCISLFNPYVICS
ncbi:hypothetical protein BDQ17DRAFT_1006593 [Cyathus striatus]|nr:hypothetical protein BDQ17DRAFT_1006593 [Cyathus striatus]